MRDLHAILFCILILFICITLIIGAIAFSEEMVRDKQDSRFKAPHLQVFGEHDVARFVRRRCQFFERIFRNNSKAVSALDSLFLGLLVITNYHELCIKKTHWLQILCLIITFHGIEEFLITCHKQQHFSIFLIFLQVCLSCLMCCLFYLPSNPLIMLQLARMTITMFYYLRFVGNIVQSDSHTPPPEYDITNNSIS